MSPVNSRAEGKIMFQLNSALAASLVVAMLSGGLACSPQSAKPADVPLGGKSDVSVKDPGVIEAANFACMAEQDALKAQGQPQTFTLVEITAAQSQVVAGVSYSLTLHVKVDGQDQTAEAVVWDRAWLKGDDKIKLTSWKFADKK